MFRLILFVLILVTSTSEGIIASEQAPLTPIATEEPEIIESLFYGDTCSPPCWFELIPGESTADDVISVLRENLLFGAFNPTLFDNQGALPSDVELQLERSGLSFMWTRGSNGFFTVNSHLAFDSGILSSMRIQDNNDILLEDVIRILGTPNHVRASVNRITANSDYLSLILFYPERNFAASLKSDPEECLIRNIGSDFRLDSSYYYASNQAETFEADSWLDQDWLVPDDIWNRWLRGHIHTSCLQAIWRIPKDSNES